MESRSPTVIWMLRAEAAAVVAATIALYGWLGYDWWRFAWMSLIPDLSIAAYLLGPRAGAAIYNAVHMTIGPLVLLAVVWCWRQEVSDVGLIWLCHVTTDRAVGYGLKTGADFWHTHLGRIGRVPAD